MSLTTCLWCDFTAEEQADFYAEHIPGSHVKAVHRSPVDTPSQKEGDVIVAEMVLAGQDFVLLNGGDQFPQSEAVSFVIYTDTQEETDRYWSAIVDNGGQESQCGWCKDKYGVNWQITPRRLIELGYQSEDPAAAKRAMQAMFTMKKIDIAKIEAAAAGEPAEA